MLNDSQVTKAAAAIHAAEKDRRQARPVLARPGDVFRADYGNQGSIECRFR